MIEAQKVVHILRVEDAYIWRCVRADNTTLCESKDHFLDQQEAINHAVETFGGTPRIAVDGEVINVPMTTPEIEAALALLTIATGDEWDISKLLKQGAAIKQHAKRTLMKRGLPKNEAADVVEKRWATMAGPIPQAQNEDLAAARPEPPGPPSDSELRERARGWRERRGR